MNIEGYLGSPLHDSNGKVMGLVVALFEKPIHDKDLTLALFQLFSGRISGEFERLDSENALIELNNSLDKKVQERTKELENTLEELNSAKTFLIESEKMAALGNLVSGIAHEVNTPLGVAITAQSHLNEVLKEFVIKLKSGITKKDMDKFVSQQSQSLPLIDKNLYRAREIVENFKRIAVDQSSMEVKNVSLPDYYVEILSTLTPIFKSKAVTYSVDICDGVIETFPGAHAQILTNLVTNSVVHGFKNHEDNKIEIQIKQGVNGRYVVDYFDNGTGIDEDSFISIMEPFYTTARGQGCTGLGLSVCFNLVTSLLHGEFSCCKSDRGAHFNYSFSGNTSH